MKSPFLSEEHTVSPCGSLPFSLDDLALWGHAERGGHEHDLVQGEHFPHPQDTNLGKSGIQRDDNLVSSGSVSHCAGSVAENTSCAAEYGAKNLTSKAQSGARTGAQDQDTPGGKQITDLSRDFTNAQPHQVTFLADEHRRPLGNTLLVTSAGACFIKPQDAHLLPPHTAALITPRPYRSFVQVLRFLDAKRTHSTPCSIHHSAHIHSSAQIDPTCHIGPGVIIEQNVIVQAHARIGAYTHIGENVVIGHNTTIENHVSIEHSAIGDHVHIQSGARIGHIGFGFVIDDQGFLEIPHQGKVILGNHVHIGANTTISRGSFTNTLIGNHTRIDALVQIAHNVHIGQHVVIASQCGIAGSCHLGDGCFLGGQVGLANGVVLAAGTKIAAKSGVMHSTHAAETLAGIPAVPAQQWRRSVVLLAKWCKKKG
jgi:UDP-3-O-[3-hydroxymyristoyl] glucosamine N-acyltransferase